MFNFFKNLDFRKYIEFIPSYLIGSGFAFTVDTSIFTLLRATYGTNYSAIIAFFFGGITSFSILFITTKYRLNKKRIGLIIFLVIGLGTLAINLVILNLIDYIIQINNPSLYINILNKTPFYALITKVISACIGFIWSSIMTNKLLFKKG